MSYPIIQEAGMPRRDRKFLARMDSGGNMDKDGWVRCLPHVYGVLGIDKKKARIRDILTEVVIFCMLQ
jgi:hypothetical protein